MNFKVIQEEDNGAIQKVYEVLIFCKPTWIGRVIVTIWKPEEMMDKIIMNISDTMKKRLLLKNQEY